MADWQVVGAIIAGFIAALGTYLGIARKLSGKIATSDAEKLWDEARELRKEYREDVDRFRAENVRLSQRVEQLTVENTRCVASVRDLTAENARLTESIEALNSRLDDCERKTEEIARLRRMLADAGISELGGSADDTK